MTSNGGHMTSPVDLPGLRDAVARHAICHSHVSDLTCPETGLGVEAWCLACQYNDLAAALPALLAEVEALRAGRCCHNVPMAEPCIACDTIGRPKDEQVRALLDELEQLRADLMGQRDAYDILLDHANELERDNAALRADLAAARAVLDSAAEMEPLPITLRVGARVVVLTADRPMWLAWQERER